MSCVISDCWVLSLRGTVKKKRPGLIYEGTHGLTFSEQFIKATLDPSRVSSQFVR